MTSESRIWEDDKGHRVPYEELKLGQLLGMLEVLKLKVAHSEEFAKNPMTWDPDLKRPWTSYDWKAYQVRPKVTDYEVDPAFVNLVAEVTLRMIDQGYSIPSGDSEYANVGGGGVLSGVCVHAAYAHLRRIIVDPFWIHAVSEAASAARQLRGFGWDSAALTVTPMIRISMEHALEIQAAFPSPKESES